MNRPKARRQNVVFINQKQTQNQMAQRLPQEKPEHRGISTQQVLIFVMGLVILGLGGYPLVSAHINGNQVDQAYQELKLAEEEAMHENIRLQQEYQLMQDPDYLAEVARRDYLYSKPGEIVFDLEDDEEESR